MPNSDGAGIVDQVGKGVSDDCRGEADAYHRVDSIFPLDRVAAAHERVESGQKRGTVIVQPGALPADG